MKEGLRNQHHSVRLVICNGFRGRVSQVRMLPGPLSGVGLLRSANPSFLYGKQSHSPLSYRPLMVAGLSSPMALTVYRREAEQET